MSADQAEAKIKPIPQPDDWPETVDGTTDWEILFEDSDTGLITLTDATTTPAQLKAQAQAIIKGVFKRKRDEPIIKKVMAFLDKLIPENAGPENFQTMQAGVRQMLRKVKTDRIKRAAAFVENKKKKSPDRRGNFLTAFFTTHLWAKVGVLTAIGIFSLIGIFSFSPERETPQGNVNNHIKWIDKYVYEHLPFDTWVLNSVKRSKESEIAIEVLITEPEHIALIKGMKRMARVAILTQICPELGSGVEDILDKGWHIWVTLKTSEENLTGGTCQYEK